MVTQETRIVELISRRDILKNQKKEMARLLRSILLILDIDEFNMEFDDEGGIIESDTLLASVTRKRSKINSALTYEREDLPQLCMTICDMLEIPDVTNVDEFAIRGGRIVSKLNYLIESKNRANAVNSELNDIKIRSLLSDFSKV